MKKELDTSLLPADALLIACSSHEERCEALCRRMGSWTPRSGILFHYDDENPKREQRHKSLEKAFKVQGCDVKSLVFAEHDAGRSLQENVGALDELYRQHEGSPIVLDASVLTKRHLLMLLRWLDDRGLWRDLCILYAEPGDYLVSKHIPLSFGLSGIRQVPGLPAAPDMSRPLHLVLFLGYEGDRALAAYECVQPMETTLIIPHPPYKPEWEGRTEGFNRDLIGLVGEESVIRVDAVDPEPTAEALRRCLGGPQERSGQSKVVCPLGTKPQAVGVYMYSRTCIDPPAVIYASPLRHNHFFFSEGIGRAWVLKEPGS